MLSSLGKIPTTSARRLPKLGTFMDSAEADVLAYIAFPAQSEETNWVRHHLGKVADLSQSSGSGASVEKH
jgi:hypothetical protein